MAHNIETMKYVKGGGEDGIFSKKMQWDSKNIMIAIGLACEEWYFDTRFGIQSCDTEKAPR